MRLRIRVTPSSRRPSIETMADGSLKVRVSAPAQGGKANKAVVEALAQHYAIPNSRVRIVAGQTSRLKLIEIDD